METLKRTVSFTDKKNSLAVIELGITHRNGYPEFTASGNYENGWGQVVDNIEPKNDEQQKLIDIWNTYHLNGMNAGTKKQTEVLSKCESNDYTECTEFLSMHDINGNPLTAIDTKRIAEGTEKANTKLNAVKKLLEDVKGFKKEWNEAKKAGWTRSKFPTVIQQMQDKSGFGDFIYKDAEEKFMPADCRFFKEYTHHIRQRIPAKYNRRLEAYVKQLEAEKAEQLETLKGFALQSALYDLHPETNELYKYGCGWIKENLPSDLWETVETICESIEEIEEEEKNEFDLVVDLAEIDEENPLYEKIEEAQEDENCGALALFLELNIDDLEDITGAKYGYGNCLYEVQGQEYYCGTEEEINEAVKEYIEQTAWAFNASFLTEQTGIPKEAFKAMQENCESSNGGIIAIIEKTCGLDSFVESALSADGFGHFLNGYDGTKNEIEYNGTTYYICRT